MALRHTVILAVAGSTLMLGTGPAQAVGPVDSGNHAEAISDRCTTHGRPGGPAGPSTGNTKEKIERVIAAALSETGHRLSYSWGAGGKGGPACGIAEANPGGYHDYNVYGFDCSGYTLYAFWKGAGIDIGDTASKQYHNGTKIPRADMRRGDLIFWKTPAEHIVHVAIYLGDNQIAEADVPRDTNSVHITTLYTAGGGDVITDHAVRFIN